MLRLVRPALLSLRDENLCTNPAIGIKPKLAGPEELSFCNRTFAPVNLNWALPDGPHGIIVSAAMNEEELMILKTKAEHLDRILESYQSLQADAGFYSKNWVELAEVIEAAIEELDGIQ